MMRRVAQPLLTIGAVACLLVSGGLARADEPDPTPTPNPTPTLEKAKAETKHPKSLADLAKGLKLQNPEGGEASKGILIDNANLRERGEGAVITEGGSLTGENRRGTVEDGSKNEDVPTDADMDKASQDIQKLKAQLEAIDKATEENKKVNLYNGQGPQYRAPGQTDPLEDQQADLRKKLEDAQSQYSDMQKARAKAGATTKPKSEAARPIESRRKQ